MQIRPVHCWWLGVAMFTPSILTWGLFLGLSVYKGWVAFPFDRYGITHLYLPLLAAVVGFIVPLFCLHRFRTASRRATWCVFFGYLAVMLAWGIVDIRQEHYQMGGHRYPNDVLTDGHRYYFHSYFTWYFLPYRWIERGLTS